jgi:hypothetical protein
LTTFIGKIKGVTRDQLATTDHRNQQFNR